MEASGTAGEPVWERLSFIVILAAAHVWAERGELREEMLHLFLVVKTEYQPHLSGERFVDWSAQLDTFADTAAFLEQLDLVITSILPSRISPAASPGRSGR